LYDVDKDNLISYTDMLTVISAIYKMVGSMVKLADVDVTPEVRADRMFSLMGAEKNGMFLALY